MFFNQGLIKGYHVSYYFTFKICYIPFEVPYINILFLLLHKIQKKPLYYLEESCKFLWTCSQNKFPKKNSSYEHANLRITLYMHTHNESFPRHRHKLCSNIVLPRRIRGPRRGSRIYPSGSRDSQARSRASINARENPSLKGRWDRGR